MVSLERGWPCCSFFWGHTLPQNQCQTFRFCSERGAPPQISLSLPLSESENTCAFTSMQGVSQEPHWLKLITCSQLILCPLPPQTLRKFRNHMKWKMLPLSAPHLSLGFIYLICHLSLEGKSKVCLLFSSFVLKWHFLSVPSQLAFSLFVFSYSTAQLSCLLSACISQLWRPWHRSVTLISLTMRSRLHLPHPCGLW